MQDLNFDCPACGQNMEAPANMAGMKIQCPGCRTLLQIPWPSEIEEQQEREKAKSATVRIDTSRGGIPPDPAKRRIVINRPPGNQA
jgi:phage FluMu protein Com